MTAPSPRPRPRPSLPRTLLGTSPLLIALLWIAGVARFRHYELSTKEWIVIVVTGFVLHVLHRRILRPRPLPPLPAGTSPGAVAMLAGALIGLLAGAVGGIFEYVVEPMRPSEVGWFLRTLWHAACSFGASYCVFLQRLQGAARRLPGA